MSDNTLATIPVPGTLASILATVIDGKPFAALKPMCEALGIDVDSQRRKLQSKSWACTVLSTVQHGDQRREMVMIDRRTLTMWLATIDENRVDEAARPTIRAYQAEAADALDAHFHTAPRTYAQALRAAADEAEARELAEAKIAELAPKAEKHDQWQASSDTVYVVEWAKTIGITQQAAFKALRDLGVLFKQKHSGVAFNVPKVGWEHYFVIVDEYLEYAKKWVPVPKVTAQGQVVLADLLIENGYAAPFRTYRKEALAINS